MGMRVTTNIAAINAQRNLQASQRVMNKSMGQLASGSRINIAADDAAGLAISEKLKAEIRSMKQANRNTQDGISLVQTAEGGLNEIGNILIRLRELSMQAATDTVGQTERGFLDKEFKQLVSEVQRISQVTQFNGINLLNGQGGSLEFQVGSHNSPEQDRMVYDTTTNDATTAKLGITDLTVAAKEGAQSNLDVIDNAIRQVSENRADIGAMQNRMQSTINNLNVSEENLSAANSRIRDVDVAYQTSELTKQNILTQSGTAMLAQANSNNMLALKLLG